MYPSSDPTSDDWLNATTACRLIGCAVSTLQRGAVLGLIEVRLDPGVAPRYRRADVLKYGKSLGPKDSRKKSDPGRAGRPQKSEV